MRRRPPLLAPGLPAFSGQGTDVPAFTYVALLPTGVCIREEAVADSEAALRADLAVRGLLEQAMCILSVKQRRLLELIFFEDKSQKEAAGILGMTQQSAAVLKGRALNRLRQRLYSEGYYVCSGGQGGGTD